MSCEDASGENTENGFMLFGVRVVTDGSIRKCVSMNNLSQYEHADQQIQVGDGGNCAAATAGYVSDDAVQASAGSHGRKRGVPWTEEEHRLFLIGLQKVGKGDWRGISRNFVKTRSPTQVASHAQKYFLRHNNRNRRRRRSSLFDITTSSVFPEPSCEEENYIEGNIQTPIPGSDGALDLTLASFLVPTPDGPIVEEAVYHPDEHNGVKIVKPIPVIANGPLSVVDSYHDIKMGLVASPLTVEVEEGHESRPLAFQTLGSFSREDIDNNGSMISVA